MWGGGGRDEVKVEVCEKAGGCFKGKGVFIEERSAKPSWKEVKILLLRTGNE